MKFLQRLEDTHVQIPSIYAIAAECQEQIFGDLKDIAKQKPSKRHNDVIPQILRALRPAEVVGDEMEESLAQRLKN